MSLLGLYDASLIGRRDASALVVHSTSGRPIEFTFGELESRSNRLAHVLRARECEAGDRVALYLPNGIGFIDCWLACVKLGVIAVPINVLYRAREIQHILTDAEPRAVITTRALAVELPAEVSWWDVDALLDAAQSASAERYTIRSDAHTPAALVYTSGTTGASKGAVLTHGNFAANALSLVVGWQFTPTDRYLATLPLFHVHGLANGLHCWLASGCHMMLVERFEHDKIAGWFDDYKPTVFFGVPTMYVRLLELPEHTTRTFGAHMRLCVSGSAPLAASVHEAFTARFGHVILERYGMTETLMNASNPYIGERRAGTVGLPLPMLGLRVLDDDGAPVADGTSGEVWVRGPNVCAGYWRRPEATAAAFVDGWFRTGDIGVRSADGYLTLEGRRSDLIISGGFNIYPREIEELLAEQPGVREAAVVGVPDRARGEIPVAYLVADAAINSATLDATVRAQLASFKVPRAYVQVDALPRTALGKVQKHLLPPWTA